MSQENLDAYIPIVLLMGFAVVMVLGAFLASKVLAPTKKSKDKDLPYECGEEPVGTAWSAFHVRFYVVGLIFIIFDVESTLMFPAATVFRKFMDIGEGLPVLIIFLLFISVLVEGIVYCWKKGDLDWVRSYKTPEKGKAEVKSEINL